MNAPDDSPTPVPLTAEFVSFRRATFFGAIGVTVAIAVWLLWRTFSPEGISVLEWIQIVLFVLLFQQVATGFWLAMFGFLTFLRGGDPARIDRTIEPARPQNGPRSATAIVIPVYNEDVARVFRAVEAMWDGLRAEGAEDGFDFFILSDSNRPESWLREETAWLEVCRKLHAFGRIFYRKRRTPRNGKSGNVADFCRRWGARYRYMVVLDADSVMTGRLLTRLVAMMDRNERVGLIQTAPRLVLGNTLFRRMQQFAARVYTPLFAGGSNYWHLFGANYWGHNAIVRIQPFIEFCDLPDLPDPDARKRHILSHDTVEAALMRKAGFDVWFAYEEDGSYEEGPPNLPDSLARDRRWCQGNLQHFWFLFAPKIDFANRFHIWMGLMGYLSSPLWLLFLVVGSIDLAWKHRISLLSALPGSGVSLSGEAVGVLVVATFALLFVPKILSLIAALRNARQYGGPVRMVLSVLLETAVWTLFAPSLMLTYTRFVVSNLLGIQVKWNTQNRSENEGLTLRQSLRTFWFPPVLGISVIVLLGVQAPYELWLLSPILAGWLLTPFLAWLTSKPGLGIRARGLGLFVIPEELPESTPLELRFVAGMETPREDDWSLPWGGLARAVVDPLTHAVHVALLRNRQALSEETEGYLEELRVKLLDDGPEALDLRQQMALLWDAESLQWLHREFWSRPVARLHPWWRARLRAEFAASTVPQRRSGAAGVV